MTSTVGPNFSDVKYRFWKKLHKNKFCLQKIDLYIKKKRNVRDK